MISFPLRPLLFLSVVVGAGCGKVTDPLPPLATIPEAVSDLSVRQIGYELVLTWTNPSRNTDQTVLDDLDRVFIRADGEVVAEFPVTGSGQAQAVNLRDASGLAGSRIVYTLELGTRGNRASAVSNPAAITVVEVPGPVAGISATVDQNRIVLEWSPPSVRPGLVDTYRVYRSDVRVGESSEARFEDAEYVEGAVYTYRITALEGSGVEGISSEDHTVTVLDTTPPEPPRGLRITLVDSSAFLVWEPNSENDVRGYRVFRRESSEGEFFPVSGGRATTAFTDPEFQAGYEYAVAAVDRSGNESAISEARGL